MSDGFAELIDTANGFFRELRQNNTRDWYEERKAFYVAEIRKPAELLADLLAEDIARMTGKAHAPKVFRIHRDVRFSKDKTPYNAHLHMMWSRKDAEGAPLWFFGASPDYMTVGMGVMAGSGEPLNRYRAFIDRDGDAVAGAIDAAREALGAEIGDWGPEPLKRVPKPYDPDHPHGDLLRRKALTLSAGPREDWRTAGLIPGVTATMKGFLPLWRLMDSAFG